MSGSKKEDLTFEQILSENLKSEKEEFYISIDKIRNLIKEKEMNNVEPILEKIGTQTGLCRWFSRDDLEMLVG